MNSESWLLRTLCDELLDKAHREPDKVAFSYFAEEFGVSGQSLTYEGLLQRANSLAVELLSQTRRGDRVILALQPGLAYPVAIFGCFFGGCVAVPTVSPRSRQHRDAILAIHADCEASHIITDARSRAALSPLPDHVRQIDLDPYLASDSVSCSGIPAALRCPRLEDLAIVQYTSGSTSRPKGVTITQLNLSANARNLHQTLALDAHHSGVTWLPPFHDMGLLGGILQPVFSGVSMCLMSPLRAMQQPARWLRAISKTRASISGAPPFAFRRCMQVPNSDLNEFDLSSWTCAPVGAEPIRMEDLESFAQKFAICGFRASAFVPCYGLAEATLMVSAAAYRSNSSSSNEGTNKSLVGCGRPPPGVEVIIVDQNALEICSEHVEGEIWVSGRNVSQGYWGRFAETELTFGGYLSDGRGPFLRTGDVGYLSGGQLFVSGRIKDLIIIAGRNYHPEDIENCIRRSPSSEKIGDVAAFASIKDGPEKLVVVAEIRRHEFSNSRTLIRQIRASISQEMELAVSDVLLVSVGRLPRTSSGKIKRHECKLLYLNGNLEKLSPSR
jgi:acyl-CoA synthetase (AMP-forming)/AMP-acid ligase II